MVLINEDVMAFGIHEPDSCGNLAYKLRQERLKIFNRYKRLRHCRRLSRRTNASVRLFNGRGRVHQS